MRSTEPDLLVVFMLKRMRLQYYYQLSHQPDKPGQKRLFASWDFAPTILESMGAVIPDRRFGLGVSLFADRPTLFEKYGREKYEEEAPKYSKLYASFFPGRSDTATLARSR